MRENQKEKTRMELFSSRQNNNKHHIYYTRMKGEERKSKETGRPAVVSSLLFHSIFTLALSGLNYGRLPLLRRRDNLFRRIVPSMHSFDTRLVRAAPDCDLLRFSVPSIYVASAC